MNAIPSNLQTPRALNPERRVSWEDAYLYEPLPVPTDHPELPLFESREPGTTGETFLRRADKPSPPSRLDEPMPARMLNEFVYCPRLFYYEFVEGVFVESEDTERGSALHAKVDKGKGELPEAGRGKAKKRKNVEPDDLLSQEMAVASEVPATSAHQQSDDGAAVNAEASAVANPDEAQPDGVIHSRSALMSSERLGVVAKMDLIEVQMARRAAEGTGRFVMSVTPVDYKAGAPREGSDANELWDTDKMQLGLQMLILRDNGYACGEGVIYYRATKQRVRLPMTEELEGWIHAQIAEARRVAVGPLPAPLVNSPKCVRCSLAPVCLPDETRLLSGMVPAARRSGLFPEDEEGEACDAARSGGGRSQKIVAPRRLMTPRDDARALYLNTPGLRVGQKGEVLVVKDGAQVLDEIRANDVTHVGLFGNIQMSTQALQMLCELEIPVAYFSMGGWFYGLMRGHGTKNVFTRIEQFRAAENVSRCLSLARKFVNGKIRNQRTLLMRLHVEAPPVALARLRQAALDVLTARSLEELLGMEGAAAALYFQHFSGMIKASAIDEEEIPGLEDVNRPVEPPMFTFDFTRRTRRPPTDPVNALLSLAYSLLSKDCTIAAHAVGFDPYVGFYHQPRFGRPALALDLMEEFRPLIAESTVLTAVNNRMITPGHFVKAGDAVNLTPTGRRVFFQAYEQRMNTLITHPVFDYKVSYRRVLELQARILARHLTGEISDYVPMVTR